MRIHIAITLFVMTLTNVFGADANLFPLQQLRLGMKSKDFVAAYPDAKQAMVQKDETGKLVEGIALCEIKDGKFWDSAVVKIKNSQVESWSYVRTKDFDLAKRDIEKIYKALRKELGKNEKKKVSRQMLKKGKVRSPTFVWQRADDFVVFSHSPVKAYKAGEPFLCRLTVAPDDKAIRELFDIADDEKSGDADLFREVIHDTPQTEGH